MCVVKKEPEVLGVQLDMALAKRLKGRLLLQVEKGGSIWYIDTTDYWFGIDSATDGAVAIYESPVYDAAGAETVWGNFRLLEGQAGNLDEAGA